MVIPYPIPRQSRQTEILVGNGGAVYGPFDALKIFDVDDVVVYSRADDGDRFAEAAVTVEKVDNLPFDYFTIEFAANLPVTSEFVVVSQRVAERSAGVEKGTMLDMTALEKELSKIATVEQELRRDLGRTLMTDFGDTPMIIASGIRDGYSLIRDGDRVVEAPNAAEIGSAQGYAAAALASSIEAEGSNLEAAAAAAIGAANGQFRFNSVAILSPPAYPSLSLPFSSPGTMLLAMVVRPFIQSWVQRLLRPRHGISRAPTGHGGCWRRESLSRRCSVRRQMAFSIALPRSTMRSGM